MCYNHWLLENNSIYANNVKEYNKEYNKQKYKKMTNDEKKARGKKNMLWLKKNPKKARQIYERRNKKVSDRIKGRQEYLKSLPVDELIQLIEQEEKFEGV